MFRTPPKNLYLLAFTLFVMMLGYGLVIPIVPFYIENLGAGGTELGLLVAAYAATRLIFGPAWGSLSDRVGRKPVLMIGVLGNGIALIMFGLASSLWMLFATRTLSGILSAATSPTTMAYIGDSTTEKERGGGMGVLGAAIGLGTIFGPGLGGVFAGVTLSLPFFIAGGLSFLALGLIVWLLPESLTPESRRQLRQAENNPTLGRLWHSQGASIRPLLVLTVLITAGLMIFYGVFGLYTLEKFSYKPEEVGVLFVVFGLVMAVSQGVLAGPLTRRWGEASLIIGALPAAAAGFVLMSLANTRLTVLLSIGFFTLATSLLTPALFALTSKRTEIPQGLTMGLSNAAVSLGRIIGPLWGGFALDIYRELPYLSGAAVMLVGFGLGILGLGHRRPPLSVGPRSDG